MGNWAILRIVELRNQADSCGTFRRVAEAHDFLELLLTNCRQSGR
jgi:hypothetical protein